MNQERMALAVCEDDEQDREKLLSFIVRYQQENELEPSPPLCFTHARALLASEKARKADALFLDIMMRGKSGMEPLGVHAARTFRAGGYKGSLVFITSSDGYYPEGFEVEAAHYLTKPFTYEQFCEAMRRVLKNIAPPERFISVPVNRAQTRIPTSVIRYVEVYGHQTLLHTVAEIFATTLPLNELEHILGGSPFLRCYRSYIVNMDHVARLEQGGFLMDDGSRVPIALRDMQGIKERYLAHCFTRMRKED